MKCDGPFVSCNIDIDTTQTTSSRAHIHIEQPIVSEIYQKALLTHQKQIQARGFERGTVPLAYLEKTYRSFIIEHMKEFLLNHCVLNTLCEHICTNHILCVGYPILESIHIEPDQKANFTFSLPQVPIFTKQPWKSITFQPPKRRNYKDIDKQVETFLTQECAQEKINVDTRTIAPGDWVQFSIALFNEKQNTPLNHKDLLWLRLGDDDPDYEALEIFIGKKNNDTFISKSIFLQHYFSKQWDSDYCYFIQIHNIIPKSQLHESYLSHFFSCTQKQDLKNLCVQIFSFRNDLSLRREIVSHLFKTLQRTIQASIPPTLLTQQEHYVLQEVQKTPDYPVYRLQKDFKLKIRQLAEKQLRETIIMDYIAREEHIQPKEDDIFAYLALHQNPRTKDLLNFHLPTTQVNGQEQPIPANIIKLSCLREKTLNYALKKLTHIA